jgi:Vilmaviridae nuclease
MTLVDQLGGTRSSHRWAEMPGNWDRLNTRALYASTNQWGIPDLPPTNWFPDNLVAYNDRWALQTAPPNSAVHFFLDDYRFETVWTKPERGLSRLTKIGTALTPDFSLWRNMPKVMQIWQVYRSRWCGAWMLQHGINVVPTIGWSDDQSFEYAFAGIPRNSTVAISTVGLLRDNEAMGLFQRGVTRMLHTLEPARVLVYGHKLELFGELQTASRLAAGTEFVYYPTRWRGGSGGG